MSQSDDDHEKVVTLEEALAMAMEMHQGGRFAEASALYQSLLNVRPDHAEALHFLGLLAHQTGDSQGGIELIRKAIAVSPEYADAYNNLGNILRLEDETAEARKAYERVVELVPDHARALNNLATLYKDQDMLNTAVATYRKAAAAAPDHPDIPFNLANALTTMGHLDESIEAYRRAIELDPEHARAYHGLGVVLNELQRNEEAQAAFEKAIQIDDGDALAHVALGDRLQAKGLLEDAMTSYRRAIAIKPDFGTAYEQAAMALYKQKKLDEQITLLECWLQQDPDNAVAKHMLSAAMGEDVPDRASDDYVQHLFDAFSKSFDRQLKGLEYQAPQLLVKQLEGQGIGDGDKLAILDAGCGTGLCAPLLRAYSRRLVGVDLSRGMLDAARRRGGYDDLVQAELTAYLTEHSAAFDVILSADTLVYFGDLEEVLAAAFAALREPGILTFSVEISAEKTDRGYHINPHGRYSHSRGYLEEALSTAGFRQVAITKAVLRREAEKDVAGWLALAHRVMAD